MFKTNINYAHDKNAIEAFKTIMNTTSSILLAGKVRTGKTTLIKSYLDLTSKNFIVLAPNQSEAIKSNVASLQAFFKLPQNIYESEDFDFLVDIEYTSEHIKFIKCLELLVIDDIILLSSAMLDCINMLLQYVRGNLEPFGGIQLILIGDLFEPIPFLNEEEKKAINKYWKSEFFFDAKCYDSLSLKCYELLYTYIDDIYYDFEMLYYFLGQDNINDRYFDWLNRAFADFEGARKDKLILTIDNNSANSINSERLEAISNIEEFKFQCDFHGNIDTSILPVEPLISLKKGAKVILINNDKIGGNYINGTIGTFEDVYNDEIVIKLEDNSTKYIKKAEWIEYEYSFDVESGQYTETPKGIFIQYPIKLGWAISMEDSKGMIFKRMHFENRKVKYYENGQVYGIYRRSHAGEGFSFTIPLRRENIRADSRIIEFYIENFGPLIEDEIIEEEINH